ncbi:fcf2 [Candida jiufengensis]|uniref:fcf2 n=1 Tax=Candida jiufengensis TaxID=497108 RepID=UPI002225B67A|nr:fcf2 [Candida jiufengensis]KAI5952577.1 fcf2 [Candida jiufengensis]
MAKSQHKQQEPTIAESSETESYTSSNKFPAQHKNPNDDKSLNELFNDLQEELNKTSTKPTQSLATNTLDSNDDYTSINYDFKNLEKKINNLPKIQSNFESSSQHQNPIKKSSSIRIHDPVVSTTKDKSSKKADAGSKWFNMSQPELTPKLKQDLQIIKQRQALDPKRHYKKQKWEIPQFFQMGTIIEGNTTYYNKLQRKQRGNNLVEEILNDDNTKKYFKRKYHEIQQDKMSGKKNHYKKVKNDRKKF